MEITYVPVLAILRDLYAQPRDMARFQRYLSTITQGTQDVVVPIVAANPMAREHVLLRVNELLAQGAEEVGAATAEEAATRLAPVPDQLKASLVVADDAGGGWTNRYLTEAGARFDSRVDRKRNFVTTLLWSSEAPTAAEIRQELLGDIYRAAYRRRHGPAPTLRAMLEQEGLAACFAGRRPVLPPETIERARAVIAPYLDEATYPQQFSALYGDEAAVSVGYAALGLPPRAGFEVALAAAAGAGRDPLGTLAAPRDTRHEQPF
ncbi:MAG TPA: hypothetical protein VHQ00_16120 [Chloroflexota bacterium]|nr:hypothetical protein [Chloroflexota bacterium]